MVEAKRLKNYLLYAIGEIILVVLGILIAVAINNNNETKKVEADTLTVAKQIESKLVSDIQLISEVRTAIEVESDKYNRYLKKDKSDKERLEVLLEAPFLVTLSIQLLPINPISDSKLNEAISSKTELSDKLIEIEEDYNAIIIGLRLMDNTITKELISNLNHIKENYDWYEKLIIPNSNFTVDEYKYFGSTDYKNRVVHMKFLYADGYDGMLLDVQSSLKQKLEELRGLLRE
ncbi:DUF6090 family protein [Winogradskyella litorisediminis]|uniref:DUF6090 family protein n=1 Tax=Winogradskyella litorisediminis TaxID=1156618 RepID=A0ABW3N5A5_9FLAO